MVISLWALLMKRWASSNRLRSVTSAFFTPIRIRISRRSLGRRWNDCVPGLGSDFPTAPARQQLERCEKWLAAKEYGKARQEYSSLADTLTGPEKDDAQVGIGASEYLAGDSQRAFRYLKALHVSRTEADAERLYYLTESARKAGDDTEMMDAVKQLGEHYPQSVWRLKALVAAGNRYLLTNDREKYTPLFKAASDTFPMDSATAYCHWKVAWDAYLNDKPERVALLREQIERYPDDSRAGTALYFLGRIAESNAELPEAQSLLRQRERAVSALFLRRAGPAAECATRLPPPTPDEDTAMWLAGIDWPAHRDLSATEPNPPPNSESSARDC